MPKKKSHRTEALVNTHLVKHFEGWTIDELITAKRTFPITARVDLQQALDQLMNDAYKAQLLGLHRDYNYSTLKFADFLDLDRNPIIVGPLQFDEIDVGEEFAKRCLGSGVWLGTKEVPFALVQAIAESHRGENGVSLEIAVPPGAVGMNLSQQFFSDLESLVASIGSYKGKVISLEQASRYSGDAGAICVHKLRSVVKEDVILPSGTMELLDRNVMEFIEQRPKLKELGMPVKKGILLYGPPGTGKTHTIHYLASQLPEHTTLLITAGQVGLLGEYMTLARFLQPAIVVIEDVDLIARDRSQMRDGCEESLLNKLLNEMDGLRDDASILFVLTTNRPEQLEFALASRPGRIDQAIEFPMPDEAGRRKLIVLYSGGLNLDDATIDWLVARTDGGSPAFIKELMRKSAQYFIKAGTDKPAKAHVEQALEDILVGGGTLNLKLLGGRVSQ
jgi:hypothetical protein